MKKILKGIRSQFHNDLFANMESNKRDIIEMLEANRHEISAILAVNKQEAVEHANKAPTPSVRPCLSFNCPAVSSFFLAFPFHHIGGIQIASFCCELSLEFPHVQLGKQAKRRLKTSCNCVPDL